MKNNYKLSFSELILEKEKMNIKEELEITPYKKKNMNELF